VLRARVAELEERLAARDARLEIAAAQLAARDAQLEAALAELAEQTGELRRRLGKDSSTSSRPPSSDSPYPKEPGGVRYRPITSRILPVSSGPKEILKSSVRQVCSPKARREPPATELASWGHNASCAP
jgi:uncharacterized coiled-coil protein SlyX